MRNADLHTHSCYSDGLISPTELVRLAKKRGVKYLALTDHDAVGGVKEAIKEGKKIGVNIIPGVEVRVRTSEILGYFIDINNKTLIKKLKNSCRTNENKVKDMCNQLRKKGYDISFKQLEKKFPKARGNINEFYLLYFFHLKGYGTTREIAVKIGEQGVKGRKTKRFTVIEGIRLVKMAKGIPVLAHPWLEVEVLKESNFKKYVKAGLKGIEINNGDKSPLRRKIHAKRIKYLAKKYNLILTSGSDFHGKELVKQMPGNHDLGKFNCDEKIIKQLERLR